MYGITALSLLALLPIFATPVQCNQESWNIFRGKDFTVRSKATSEEICPGSPGTAGYIDSKNGENHMFFWMFESRNNPATDPVIIWLTGGPGGSSVSFGLLQELGSCVYSDEANATVYNEYAWNANATVIFVDQPFNVGFSHSPHHVKSLKESSKDLYEFVESFLTAFPQYSHQDFYVAGESYGGSYVPALAVEIQKHRSISPLARLAAATSSTGLSRINLKGIMVGNGLLENIPQRRGFYETGCTGPSPILNETQCAILAGSGPRCEVMEAACRASGNDWAVCQAGDMWCQPRQSNLIHEAGLNPYDFRKKCLKPGLCDDTDGLYSWTNSTKVRKELGVDPEAHWYPINSELSMDFLDNGEVGYPSAPWVEQLLEQSIRVLIYVGNKDWYCQSAGMRHMVDALQWSGAVPFSTLGYKEMYLSSPTGSSSSSSLSSSSFAPLWGWHKKYDLLSFFEIDEAGHLAPHDKPRETLIMLNRWIGGEL